MRSSKAASKATRQLRQSGLPLARAAVHVGRQRRGSSAWRIIFGFGVMAVLGGGAAIAMVALKPADTIVAASPVVVTPVVAAAPAAPVETARAEQSPVVVAATTVLVPQAETTPFAAKRAADLASAVVTETETAAVLSNLQAVMQPQPALAPEPDCRSSLNAVAQAMNVTFGVSSNMLDPAAAEALDALATKVATCEGVQIVVAGHSDTTGSPEANMALSWQRADEVVAAIVSMGHDPKLFNPVGYGARNPVMVNGVVDEAASRRVEFMVTMAEASVIEEVIQ
jgi:outer membrane protein OmpA-like peptidoglycan-associated protein